MADQNTSAPDGHPLSDPSTWVARHGDYLYGYALRRLRNPAVAEDIVQETFVAALKARDRFAGQSTERTWLVGILKNKVIDHIRKVSRETNLEDDEIVKLRDDDNYRQSGAQRGTWKSGRRPADWIIDIDDGVEQKEFWKYLSRCLDGLDDRLAVMFVLREIEQMESQEICNTIGITPTNLRVMLYRARKQLRICLEKLWLSIRKRA